MSRENVEIIWYCSKAIPISVCNIHITFWYRRVGYCRKTIPIGVYNIHTTFWHRMNNNLVCGIPTIWNGLCLNIAQFSSNSFLSELFYSFGTATSAMKDWKMCLQNLPFALDCSFPVCCSTHKSVSWCFNKSPSLKILKVEPNNT